MISISAMHFHRLFFSRVSRGPSAFSWKLHLSATAPVRLISSAAKKSRPEGSAARSKKTQAASESEAFYVVQKGGITGVYRNFEDCKYMVSDPTCNVYKGHSLQKKVEDLLAARGMKNALYCISSMDLMGEFFGALAPCQGSENHIAVVEGRDVPKVVSDPTCNVYKGHSLQKKVEDLLAARGMKNALYCISSMDLMGEFFGALAPCQGSENHIAVVEGRDVPKVVSDPTCNVYKGHSLQKKVEDLLAARGMKNALYCISSMDLMGEFFGALAPCQGSENHIAVVEGRDVPKVAFVEHMDVSTDSVPLEQSPFVLEFDGSSKGNPGKAGAGAVIKSAKGNVISRVREGLGITTNNVAEYKALILGMKFCLKNGINEIRVKGDSKLVCMQLQGSWKTNAEHISALHKEAMELKKKFLFFEIKHVLRSLNSDADALANSAAELEGGVIAEDTSDAVSAGS